MRSWILFLIFLPFVTFSQWNLHEEVTSGLDVYRVADIKSGESELLLQEYYEDVMFCLHDSTFISDTQTVVLEITYGLETKTFILKDLIVNDYTIILSPDVKKEEYFNYLELSRSIKISLVGTSPTKCYQFSTIGTINAYNYIIDL
jgi:hypothetical protein